MTHSAALALALAALACACGANEPSVAYPADTAIAVGDVALSAAEIDAAARWAALIEPLESTDQHRRYALHHLIVPRAAASARFPAEREAALALARAALAAARGEPGAPPAHPTAELASGPPRSVVGTAAALGPWLFGPASELALGDWTEPIELVGEFVLARLVERTAGSRPGLDVLTLAVQTIPYLPAETTRLDVDRWVSESVVVVVDPAWDDIVPESYRRSVAGKPDQARAGSEPYAKQERTEP